MISENWYPAVVTDIFQDHPQDPNFLLGWIQDGIFYNCIIVERVFPGKKKNMFTPSGSTPLHIAWISHPRDRMKGFMWRSKSSIAFTSCEKTKAEVTMNWRAGYFNWCFFGGKRIGYLYSKSGLKSFQIKESESFEKGTSPPSVKNGSPNMDSPPPNPLPVIPSVRLRDLQTKNSSRCCFPAPPDTLLSHATFVQSPSPSSSSPWAWKNSKFDEQILEPFLIIQHSHAKPNCYLVQKNIHGGMVDVCTLSIKILPNSFPVEGS